MLVLTRKVGQQVVIADNVVVTVLAVNGTQVRLGFVAPPDVPIWRKEVIEPAGVSLREARSPEPARPGA